MVFECGHIEGSKKNEQDNKLKYFAFYDLLEKVSPEMSE